MNILYDYQAFFYQTHGGVSNCFAQLLDNMPSTVNFTVGVKECENVHLINKEFCPKIKPIPKILKGLMSQFKFSGGGFLYRNAKGGIKMKLSSRHRNRKYCIELLKSRKFDVFHPTYYSGYFLNHIGKTPFVITIHDMIHELYPNCFGLDGKMIVAQKKQLAQKAAHIIAVSQNTKNDIIDILKIPESKISVVWHGAPENPEPTTNPKPIVEGRYILFVGARKNYKNFAPFVTQFAKIAAEHKDLRLVCTSNDFSKQEIALFQQLGITNRVGRIFANSSEMQNLYANSQCLVFPSLYEGFGIPILEAYKAQCPVLLNKKSCFPEIAGDAAIYFTMDEQKNDFYEVMTNFLNYTPQQRQKLIENQNNRLKLFSWKNSAQKLTEIYSGLL